VGEEKGERRENFLGTGSSSSFVCEERIRREQGERKESRGETGEWVKRKERDERTSWAPAAHPPSCVREIASE
jgi:hypothetical protein